MNRHEQQLVEYTASRAIQNDANVYANLFKLSRLTSYTAHKARKYM